MREDRLLERIQAWEKEPKRRGKEDSRRIVDSVLRHLQRILNTKQGNVPIADDYGLPDFTNFAGSFPDSVREIERAIKGAIQKYEPRLTAVRVTFIPQEEDYLSLRFQIIAKLSLESKTQVYIETVVNSEGKIDIRG